jgi:hypothetical protein
MPRGHLMKKPAPEKEPTWVQGQFEGMPAPKHLSGGMDEHEQVLKAIGETAPMMIRAPRTALPGIAASHKLLSQHDTGTSGALLDSDERIGWEDQAFPDRVNHPVYGYLSHGEFRDNIHGTELREYAKAGEGLTDENHPVDAVHEYGNTAFELKPHMREHITFSHGDSLGRDPHRDRGRPSKLVARPGDAPSSRFWNFGPDQAYTEMQVHPPDEPGVDVNKDVSRAIHYRDDRTPEGGRLPLARENRASMLLASAGVPHEVRSIGQTEQHPLSPELGPVVKNLEVSVLRHWKPGQKWEPRTPKRGNI